MIVGALVVVLFVASLALALAVGRDLHLAPDELDDLKLGAELHDIGKLAIPDAILLKPGPLTPEERAIVANIARYHRKGPPDASHPGYRELHKEARGKVRGLSGILRIADALDREHKQKIESARAAMDRAAGRVTLFLRGEGDRELEEWAVRAKGSLWRDEYDLDVEIAKAEVGA